MATRSSATRCNYCHKELRSDSAMKRHIAATPKCKHAWEKDLLASNPKTIGKSTTTHLEVAEAEFDNQATWDDMHDFVPEPSPEPAGEGDDREFLRVHQHPKGNNHRFVEAYPRPVGIPTGQGKTNFQVTHDQHLQEGRGVHSPFANDEEWELAKWLSRRVGQKAIDEYLKLSIVSR